MTEKRIQFSNIVFNQLPAYVREEFPLVAEFLSEYYRAQEFQGAPIDLIQNKDVSIAHKFYFPILWISNAVIFYLSYDLWLWGIILPGFLAFHSYALNTSINHYPSLGYRYYPTNDNSTNVLWLWPCLFGDAWHNNHHADPKNSNFSKRWWEIDPAHWLIKLIRTD